MADAGDENWKEKLPVNHGESLHFIMRKSLTATDVSRKHEKLNIPAPVARSKLFPLLLPHERNITIKVVVHTRNKWKFAPKMTTSQTSGQTLIFGKEYKSLIAFNKLKEGEEVALWAFRSGEKLCFALERVAP
jgi:hypothetical protein